MSGCSDFTDLQLIEQAIKWNSLHPECRTSWERGLTDYPVEEHVRDCDACQDYQHYAMNERALLLELVRWDLKHIAEAQRLPPIKAIINHLRENLK